MKSRDFYFDLPAKLLAKHPSPRRDSARLLRLKRAQAAIEHARVTDLPTLLSKNDVLVVNNSRVRKARLSAQLDTGRQYQLLFVEEEKPRLWLVLTGKTKSLKPGKRLLLPNRTIARVAGRQAEMVKLELNADLDESYFNRFGQIPLPPYLKRPPTDLDSSRYQTVFAQKSGSVAAPTAGLHLTQNLLENLNQAGVEIVEITLHVGPGTFLPVRSDNLYRRRLHRETYRISKAAAFALNQARASGKKITALGTTSLRAIESSCLNSQIIAGAGQTELFIFPGYQFKFVDKLITNFHTPESSLIMLAAAFAGKEFLFDAYRIAIEKGYRFFSYGDAMLIE